MPKKKLVRRNKSKPFQTEYGGIFWYLPNGELHRVDGPAKEFDNGAYHWYRHGQLHRTDGPAVINAGELEEWWIDGIQYSYSEWREICYPIYLTFINTSKIKSKPIIVIL